MKGSPTCGFGQLGLAASIQPVRDRGRRSRILARRLRVRQRRWPQGVAACHQLPFEPPERQSPKGISCRQHRPCPEDSQDREVLSASERAPFAAAIVLQSDHLQAQERDLLRRRRASTVRHGPYLLPFPLRRCGAMCAARFLLSGVPCFPIAWDGGSARWSEGSPGVDDGYARRPVSDVPSREEGPVVAQGACLCPIVRCRVAVRRMVTFPATGTPLHKCKRVSEVRRQQTRGRQVHRTRPLARPATPPDPLCSFRHRPRTSIGAVAGRTHRTGSGLLAAPGHPPVAPVDVPPTCGTCRRTWQAAHHRAEGHSPGRVVHAKRKTSAPMPSEGHQTRSTERSVPRAIILTGSAQNGPGGFRRSAVYASPPTLLGFP